LLDSTRAVFDAGFFIPAPLFHSGVPVRIMLETREIVKTLIEVELTFCAQFCDVNHNAKIPLWHHMLARKC
jgi:hypothetical protein